MANSVELQDVADLAGVSIGTASQAINNRPTVALATRSRVIDAAHTLGYPIKEVQDVKPYADIGVIGMLTKHDYGNAPEVSPFYSHIQAGIESECRKFGINLMFANVEVDESNHPVVWPAMIDEVILMDCSRLVPLLKMQLDSLVANLIYLLSWWIVTHRTCLSTVY